MAVDAVHGHIFISQGSTSQNGILVTDLTGKVITTIGGQTGSMGIALSSHYPNLYAALRRGRVQGGDAQPVGDDHQRLAADAAGGGQRDGHPLSEVAVFLHVVMAEMDLARGRGLGPL